MRARSKRTKPEARTGTTGVDRVTGYAMSLGSWQRHVTRLRRALPSGLYNSCIVKERESRAMERVYESGGISLLAWKLPKLDHASLAVSSSIMRLWLKGPSARPSALPQGRFKGHRPNNL